MEMLDTSPPPPSGHLRTGSNQSHTKIEPRRVPCSPRGPNRRRLGLSHFPYHLVGRQPRQACSA